MNRIILASAQIIMEKGVDGAGINAIATQAKVNKILIYRYFSGWNGVLEALYQQILAKIDASRTAKASTSQGRAMILADYTLQYYKELQSNLAFQNLLLWQMTNRETELARRFTKLQDQSIEQVEDKSDTVQAGVLRLLIAGLTHSILTGNSTTGHLTEQVINQICALFNQNK